MKKRTVLDFKRKAPNLPQQVYEIKRINDIYNAIEDQEIRGYQDGIHVRFAGDKLKNIYTEITEGHGFDITFDSKGIMLDSEGNSQEYTHIINYFGYSVWVYYDDYENPIHFDFQGSKTMFPPHEYSRCSKWYENNSWFKFEKLTLI
jgi:hypothetical protein